MASLPAMSRKGDGLLIEWKYGCTIDAPRIGREFYDHELENLVGYDRSCAERWLAGFSYRAVLEQCRGRLDRLTGELVAGSASDRGRRPHF
jgi:hypothetical protein